MAATKSKPRRHDTAIVVGKIKRAPTSDETPAADDVPPATAELGGEIVRLPLDKLDRSPYQTRQDRPAPWLAESLRTEGRNVEPILARTAGPEGRHELISGHTRVQEARGLGWTHIEGRLVECDDETARRLVFVANAKREDLTPIEQAENLKGMVDQYAAAGRSMRQLARDIGVSQGEISNLTRLLDLPADWRDRVISGEITKSVGRLFAAWTHRPVLLAKLHGDLDEQRRNHGEHWKPWSERDAKHFLETAMQQLTAPVPSPCPPDQWEALDIEDVPLPLTASAKRCWNVKLAQSIQRKNTAATKQSSQAAAKARAAKPAQQGLSDWKLKSSWVGYLLRSVGRLVPAKPNKLQQQMLVRVALMSEDARGVLRDALSAECADEAAAFRKLLTVDPADFDRVLVADLRRRMTEGVESLNWLLSLEEALVLADQFGWSLRTFVPDMDFVASWPAHWQELFAGACSVDPEVVAKGGQSQVAALLAAWRPGWVPQELAVKKQIEGESPQRGKKAAKRK